MQSQPDSNEPVPPMHDSGRVMESRLALLRNINQLQNLLDAVNDMVLILGKDRQILFANRNVVHLVGVKDESSLLGLQPGEALGCQHACDEPCGLGTSKFCRACGAAQAILSAQVGQGDLQECRILKRQDGTALDLLVHATPLEVDGHRFTVCAITDISHEKRRRTFERIFFHDLMNVATGLKMLCAASSRDSPRWSGTLANLCIGVEQLTEEIAAQRDLLAAEQYDLPIQPVAVFTRSFLADLLESWSNYARNHRCRLHLDEASEDINFVSDRTLVSRVLGNMIKNAIEASDQEERITAGCGSDDKGGGVKFWVHNPHYMPPDVQVRLFKRSFSTKGPGRGLGTYSMKLVSERYLGGRIRFITTVNGGTTFTACFPLAINSGESSPSTV